jgi:SAM-dependent methyltransferase
VEPVEKSDFEIWLNGNNYFDDLAVFSFGPLHPGGINASNLIFNKINWKGKKVLDIGIGNGTTIKYLSSLGSECFGVEKSAFMIKSAIQNGIDEKKLFNEDVCNFKTNHFFDVILFEGVIGFLSNPISVIKTMTNYLTNEGIVLINDWIPFQKHSSIDESYFNVYGISEPTEIMNCLDKELFDFKFEVYETISKGLNNKAEEIFKRVESFFYITLSEVQKSKIIGKLNKMKNALGSDTPTKYYILEIKKNYRQQNVSSMVR